MAERSFSLGTPEIAGGAALRETLHAQQELLQQLYNELDVEREASATATNEALSMILRLQGEKAAVEMEASQYKRIAEEKMFHAQETLEIFRDLIYHKEMQIASLEFQVQALRFKLLSLGCSDIVSCETQFPENMLVKRPEIWGERGPPSQHLKRGSSMPLHSLKDRECSVERDKSKFDGLANDPEKLIDIETGGDSSAFTKVQDIFEVPTALMQELFNAVVVDKSNIGGKRPPFSPGSDNRRSSDGLSAEQQLFPKRPAFGVVDLELQQLNRRVRRLEDERITSRREISAELPVEDETRLLKEIKEQLNLIQEEVFSWRSKKYPPLEQPALQTLKEAMLHFWL